MNRRSGLKAGLLTLGLVLLAACAEVPPAPEQAPVARIVPHDEQLSRAIARHQQFAQQYQQAGDLAAAAAQWQILTVLTPQERTYQHELTQTRAAIDSRARENLAAGKAALKGGETDRAADAMLRVLALDPENVEAAQALREIEKRRQSRVQAGRAAKVNGAAAANLSARPAAARPPADAGDAYSLEQPLEMFRAGDTAGGLRDLHRFVDANPGDKSARNRIGTVVYDRARELETQGQREQALGLYLEAVALRGDAAPGWSARIQATRKALGDEYFDKGAKDWPANRALAIKDWETSLRFDPQNARSAARLKEAQAPASAAPAAK